MTNPAEAPLLSVEQIQQRVQELGKEISSDYQGKSLVVIGVLKGAFIFMADLVRAIDVPLHCDFLRVRSYSGTESTGEVQLELDLSQSIGGKDVLLVEDIVDSGRTLRFLLEHLKAKGANSLKVCSLLYKELDASLKDKVDYIGFTIPDEFIVGYGMDYEGQYRQLANIVPLNSKS